MVKIVNRTLCKASQALLGQNKTSVSRRDFMLSITAVAISVAGCPAMASVEVGSTDVPLREVVLNTHFIVFNPELDEYQELTQVLELGCAELINRRPTGCAYHQYVNPYHDGKYLILAEYGVPNFLNDCPVFADIVDDFLAFVGDSPLVAHYADFHIGCINSELARLDRSSLPEKRVVDTALLAKRRFPGAFVSILDLCKRFDINYSPQKIHHALSRAQILAEIYPHIVDSGNAENGGQEC